MRHHVPHECLFREDLRKKIIEALRRGMTKSAKPPAPSLCEPFVAQALRQAGRGGTLPRPQETTRLQAQDGPQCHKALGG